MFTLNDRSPWDLWEGRTENENFYDNPHEGPEMRLRKREALWGRGQRMIRRKLTKQKL